MCEAGKIRNDIEKKMGKICDFILKMAGEICIIIDSTYIM